MLRLHAKVSKQDALAAFGGLWREMHLGCIAQTPTGVLYFLASDQVSFSDPDSLLWSPEGLSVDVVAEAISGEIDVFFCHVDVNTDTYTYIRRATVSGYGKQFGYVHSIMLHLAEKVAIEDWGPWGGYIGWRLRGDYEGALAANEFQTFEAIIESTGQPFFRLVLERYEGDQLTLHTNDNRARLAYQDPGRAGLNIARGELSRSDRPEKFLDWQGMYFGEAPERTLPKGLAVEAVRSFFRTGAIPGGLAWYKFDDDWRRELTREIVDDLRLFFLRDLEEAEHMVSRYLDLLRETSDDTTIFENLSHDTPETTAFDVEWRLGLGKPFASREFLEWRRAQYEERRGTTV